MKSRTTRLAFLAFAAATAGCASNQGKDAAIGAGGGALAGAGIGALAGGGEGALIGAAIGAGTGAAAGAVIGRYMDQQQKALKDVKGAKVEREGDKLIVRFDSAILFDTNKSALRSQSKRDLNKFAKVLVQYKETDLIVEGHTDSTGNKDFNRKLSGARAGAVIRQLINDGVARGRMVGRGLGDAHPIADNATPAGRQQNRRVQVQIAANQALRKKDAVAQGR
ncbi:MAG TPA: OmpA family protein [Polyangia bacterium]|jgi:outer membrane protein OmpA-like peptidoglycan-associated protein|nr:OmpA family protein [Polyangia bacterium]